MTAEGQLFVEEELRDAIEELVKKGKFKKLKKYEEMHQDGWDIDGNKFSGAWQLYDVHGWIEAPITDALTNKVIATVKAKNNLDIEGGMTMSGFCCDGEWLPSTIRIYWKRSR